MITTDGKVQVKRYLARDEAAIANYISFGISAAAEAVGDTSLGFEISRIPLSSVTYDYTNNYIVFKSEIPSDYAGAVYEAALLYSPESSYDTIITTFDSVTESWLTGGGADATYTTSNVRVGADAVILTAAASGTSTVSLANINLDLSNYLGADKILLAGYTGSNVSSFKILFKTDVSNYYTLTFTPSAGYYIGSLTKSAATVTGAPSWSNITSIDITLTATAGGSATFTADAIRIQSAISSDVLVAREVLPAPLTKVAGMVQEIELALGVTV